MRKIVTAEQMRTLDRAAVEEWGIPGVVLMENAGRAAADELERALPDLTARRVAILCGRGNNGGDGFVIGRHLLNRGVDAACYLLGRVAELSGDARVNADSLLAAGGPLVETDDAGRLAAGLERAGVIVDALLGTGLTSAPRGLFAQAIELINAASSFVLALDLPSGVDADNGRVYEPAVRADLTVTMGLLKRGLRLYPGRTCAGRTVVADIGIPAARLQADPDMLETEARDIARLLPARPPDGHKGSFGTVLVIAGSRGFSGAACLCGMAAVRSGAGLVRMGFPSGIADVIESRLLEPVKHPLPETPEGTLDPSAAEPILELAREADSIALGPGLGAGPASRELVRRLLPGFERPVVIDADALNCLAGETGLLRELKAPAVLTPHPGEMARLDPGAGDRVGSARGFATGHRVFVVLKGAPTIIAGPSGPAYLNPTGDSGLGTGGTGDVLTGLIAGLIAQGAPALDAALAGTWLHGRAGELGSEALSPYGLAAGDLLEYLPKALREATGPGGREQ